MNKTKQSKMKAGALLAVTAALMVVSSFSLSAFAQSTLDSKQNVVLSESQPPKSPDGQTSVENARQETKGGLEIIPVGMTQEQAERYVKTATEKFNASPKSPLPQTGYRIKCQFENSSGYVTVTWLPNSYNDLEPLGTHTEKIYFVTFKNADLTDGTDDVMIGEINGEPGVLKISL